jgi:hypothetical protein
VGAGSGGEMRGAGKGAGEVVAALGLLAEGVSRWKSCEGGRGESGWRGSWLEMVGTEVESAATGGCAGCCGAGRDPALAADSSWSAGGKRGSASDGRASWSRGLATRVWTRSAGTGWPAWAACPACCAAACFGAEGGELAGASRGDGASPRCGDGSASLTGSGTGLTSARGAGVDGVASRADLERAEAVCGLVLSGGALAAGRGETVAEASVWEANGRAVVAADCTGGGSWAGRGGCAAREWSLGGLPSGWPSAGRLEELASGWSLGVREGDGARVEAGWGTVAGAGLQDGAEADGELGFADAAPDLSAGRAGFPSGAWRLACAGPPPERGVTWEPWEGSQTLPRSGFGGRSPASPRGF